MSIQSKATWLKVKKEYDPTQSPYLCRTSPTFGKLWRNESSFIKDLGREFDSNVVIGWVSLFNNEDTEIRKDFINWCINKFN